MRAKTARRSGGGQAHASLRRHYPHRYQGCDLTRRERLTAGPLASIVTVRQSGIRGKPSASVPAARASPYNRRRRSDAHDVRHLVAPDIGERARIRTFAMQIPAPTLHLDGHRRAAVESASAWFDEGRLIDDLPRRVAIRTESQNSPRAALLLRYLNEEIAPSVERMGFAGRYRPTPSTARRRYCSPSASRTLRCRRC